MIIMQRILLASVFSLALAGCSSGGDGAASGCLATLTGGGTTISIDTSGCAGCAVNEESLAIDESAESAARVVFDATGGQVRVRASAQMGVVFPGGNFAGVVAEFPRATGPGYANVGMTVRTYLDGMLQQQVSSTTTTIGNIDGNGNPTTYGGATSMAFDAVEAELNLSGEAATVRIFDFCADQ